MTISLLLAILSLVPQPQKVMESQGTTANIQVSQIRDKSIPAEGYRLKISQKGVEIASSDEAGAFYAEKTLDQLRIPGEDGKMTLPLVEIVDSPRFGWRGVLIDDCRHFFGKNTVKGVLDLMAQHKLNVLHWHLTDNGGWRLEIPGHPELTKVGAVRTQSIRHGGSWHESGDGIPYGPYFYTEKDLREIIAYAAQRHIKIVPEIEFPGHSYALIKSYPDCTCFPERVPSGPLNVIPKVGPSAICIGNDKAIALLEDVLEYVSRVFPSDVISIAGDECSAKAWQECPKCQDRIKAEKLGDPCGLQPWLTRRIVGFLSKRGKRTIGWDEYLKGDVPPEAIGLAWHDKGDVERFEALTARECIERGHEIVMVPRFSCYFDYQQGIADDPFQYCGSIVTLEKVYSFNPCEGLPENLRHRVLGGQCCNWSEMTWNEYDLAWKMWPRTCALAEVLWTGEHRPGFEDFKRRMAVHRKRLVAQLVNCAPLQ